MHDLCPKLISVDRGRPWHCWGGGGGEDRNYVVCVCVCVWGGVPQKRVWKCMTCVVIIIICIVNWFQLTGEDLGIVRQFPFSSSLQRMSVITRRLGAQNFVLYVKGSPEMVVSLSSPDTGQSSVVSPFAFLSLYLEDSVVILCLSVSA